jgi:hypothetical protein
MDLSYVQPILFDTIRTLTISDNLEVKKSVFFLYERSPSENIY